MEANMILGDSFAAIAYTVIAIFAAVGLTGLIKWAKRKNAAINATAVDKPIDIRTENEPKPGEHATKKAQVIVLGDISDKHGNVLNQGGPVASDEEASAAITEEMRDVTDTPQDVDPEEVQDKCALGGTAAAETYGTPQIGTKEEVLAGCPQCGESAAVVAEETPPGDDTITMFDIGNGETISLLDHEPNPDLLDLVPNDWIREHLALPIDRQEDGSIRIAISDLKDVDSAKAVLFLLPNTATWVLADKAEIEAWIEDHLTPVDEEEKEDGPSLLDAFNECTEDDAADDDADEDELETIILADYEPDPELVKLIPLGRIIQHLVLPIDRQEDGSIRIAISDPTDVETADTIRFMFSEEVVWVLCSREEIINWIENDPECYAHQMKENGKGAGEMIAAMVAAREGDDQDNEVDKDIIDAGIELDDDEDEPDDDPDSQ